MPNYHPGFVNSQFSSSLKGKIWDIVHCSGVFFFSLSASCSSSISLKWSFHMPLDRKKCLAWLKLKPGESQSLTESWTKTHLEAVIFRKSALFISLWRYGIEQREIIEYLWWRCFYGNLLFHKAFLMLDLRTFPLSKCTFYPILFLPKCRQSSLMFTTRTLWFLFLKSSSWWIILEPYMKL